MFKNTDEIVRNAVANNRLEGLYGDAEALEMTRKMAAGEVTATDFEAWKAEQIGKIRAEFEPR